MAVITKATPRSYQDGIRDDSDRLVPLEQEQVPQHLPVFTIMARKGELKTKFQSSAAMIASYGSETFDEAGKYYSHQTAALNLCAGEGQMVAVRRVADPTAAAAAFCLGVEYVAEDLVVYERDAEGDIVLDVNGDPVPVVPAQTVTGYRKRPVLLTGVTADNYKSLVEKPGALTNTNGDASVIVPLIAGVCEVGEYGNHVGFRMELPHLRSQNPADGFVAEDQRTFIYRWQWFERPDERSTPALRRTLLLAREVDFSFKKGAKNSKTNASFDKGRVKSLYERKGSGVVQIEGPAKDLFFYEANIEKVLKLLFDTEVAGAAAQGQTNVLLDKHEMNLFGDVDFKGKPFLTVVNEPGGIVLDSLTTHYMSGGTDGEVSEAMLDSLARAFYRGDWDNPDEPLNDVAQYPISQIYDTGFTLETKYAILETMGKRHDIKVDVCTQDLTAVENSIESEIAVGTALRVRALLMPESIVHGTQTCRASVWGSMGTFVDSIFGRRLPLIFDIIKKRSRFMGAGNGQLKAEQKFSARELNSVEALTDVTHTYKSFGIKDTFWDLGINYVQYRDRSDIFWPAYQTVYSDDTSALNSDLVVSCLVNVKKQADYHWAINTNTDGLTDDEFFERSDNDFGNLVRDRYAGLIDLTWQTVKTPADNARGYSWALDINAAAGPSRTVGQYNITVVRPEN
jgi:hypothetical protein